MNNENQLPKPDNEKLLVYSLFAALYKRLLPASLREFIRTRLCGTLSTEVPDPLDRSLLGVSALRAGIYAAAITFIFTFVVTATIATLEKTLMGSADGRVYFLDDVHNLVLYTLVCPGYVGFGVALVVSMIGGTGRIKALTGEIAPGASYTKRISIPIAVLLILLISILGTSQYIADVLNSEKVKEVYWFVGLGNEGGERISAITVYYAILNFSLLFLTMVFIGAFLSGVTYALDVGAALSRAGREVELRFEELQVKLETFNSVYACAKALVFLYMLNFFIWAESPLNNTDNLLIARIAITVIGVFVVSFPRYAIEYEWHLYKWRSGRFSGGDLKHDDIRPLRIRVWAWVFDGLLIGGFIVTEWVVPRLDPLFD